MLGQARDSLPHPGQAVLMSALCWSCPATRLGQGGHPLVPQPGDLHRVWSASSESLAGTAGLGGGCLVWGSPWGVQDGWQSFMCFDSETNDGRAGWKRPQEIPHPNSTTANTRDQPDARSRAGAWWAMGNRSSELLCGSVPASGWDRRKHKGSAALALDLSSMVLVGCGGAWSPPGLWVSR